MTRNKIKIKGLLFVTLASLLVLASILYSFVFCPYKKKLNDYISETYRLVSETSFFTWDHSNNIPDEYINNSNYSFVILDKDRILSSVYNRSIIVDLSSIGSYSDFKNIAQEMKKSPNKVIGAVISKEFFDKEYKKFDGICKFSDCFTNYLTQFFILDGQDLSSEAMDFALSNPRSFSIISNDLISRNRELTTNLNVFTVENISVNDNDHEFQLELATIVGKAKELNYKYMFLFEEEGYYDLSQFPEVEGRVVIDSMPIITWTLSGPHNAYEQSEYSVIISDPDREFGDYMNKYPAEKNIASLVIEESYSYQYSTGRQATKQQFVDIVPETPLIGEVHNLLIQVWADSTYNGLVPKRSLPLYPQRNTLFYSFEKYKKEEGNGNFEKIAWVPHWGIADALASLNEDPDQYTTISPVWFTPLEDGTLKIESNFNHGELMHIASQNGIKVIPTISLFDAEILSEILNNHLDEHVQETLYYLDKYNYDGIDIDYEMIFEKDREVFFKFITDLSAAVHERDKIFSVTVLSKWTDTAIYGAYVQTRDVQDWERIGKLVDQFRIMSYDLRVAGSTGVGPIAPYSWYVEILNYAKSKVDKDKIVMGIPLYGVSWAMIETQTLKLEQYEDGKYVFDEVMSRHNLGLTFQVPYVVNGMAIGRGLAMSRKNNYGFYSIHDKWNYEFYNIYYQDGTWWFESFLNREDIQRRIDTAYEAGVGGVSMWRLESW